MPNRPSLPARAVLLGLLLCLWPTLAGALVRLDFEQKYLVHRGHQVWDFCVVRQDSTYHCFYHAVPETDPQVALADTIWHAVTPDLARWQVVGPALVIGSQWWEQGGIWAPDVVMDSTSGRWAMMYTAVDSLHIQRPCLAWSEDLQTWTREPLNPVFEPDSTVYAWSPTERWSAFRDPCLFRHGGNWQMFSTANLRGATDLDIAVIHRAESPDLVHWTEGGVVLQHGAPGVYRALESCQVVERDGWYHIYFTEYDVPGTQHIVSDTLAWDWAARALLDFGNAPELNSFDPGSDVFGRLAIGQYPLTGAYFYTIRFDTLEYLDGGLTPRVLMPHPLQGVWEERSGTSSLAQPTFGDNPVMRGEPSCGLVGNGYYGSQEYYQGPLSGRGGPGIKLGDTATGGLRSFPFTIEGNAVQLRVGGGDYPQTCYVALLDAGTDSVLFRATGQGQEMMSPRSWYVRPLRGRQARIVIVDNEMGAGGHINVDEIAETMDYPVGDLRIRVLPDTLAAGWHLVGPAGWDTTGTGGALLASLPTGDYSLQWLDVPQWRSPAPVAGSLAEGDTLVLSGTYVEIGTVAIDVGPAVIEPCWQLLAPDSTVHTGCGDAVLPDLPAGVYRIAWQDVPFWVPPVPNPAVATLIRGDTLAFAGQYRPLPRITSITDVKNDQGRRVRLIWDRCVWDAAGDSVVITGYGIYRRQDAYKAAGAGASAPAATTMATTATATAADALKLAGWDWLATVPARTDDVYQYVAETLCDSTAAAGICWSTFMVSAMTPDPAQFYDSDPDSGYSVDNLAPSVPQGLLVAYAGDGNTLAWEESLDQDLWHYRVYRSQRQDGDCAPLPTEPVAVVAGTTWTDDLTGGEAWQQCYRVTAVDFAGNESPATDWRTTQLAGTAGSDLPAAFRLHPCYPNPFNPRTTVRFDLPARAPVDLAVYDLAGRLVRQLVDGRPLEAGRHELTWAGDDAAGHRVAAGVYFLRLRAGSYRQTQRMALIK